MMIVSVTFMSQVLIIGSLTFYAHYIILDKINPNTLKVSTLYRQHSILENTNLFCRYSSSLVFSSSVLRGEKCHEL